ncbi:MAG TPA: 2-phosphosulfolactate phosphatase [Bacteroidales bacterium]|nr:2-phosphosulfolactate phosphatase [Bacteroidales bacterium]HRZ50025.1 2-phosphosulfolactate phosphatase [Bacteroidales bacterium]
MNLEVCFSPAFYNLYQNPNAATVVVDVFRATTAICTAFDYGVKSIIPVTTLEEAQFYQDQGYLIAAERNGIKPDFADFGNSPFNFMQEGLEGKTIVYSTTNGTQAIQMAGASGHTVIGAFINISAVAEYLTTLNKDVIILCAGWKDRFSLEDAICSGALATKLLESGAFTSTCDSVTASIDLWRIASMNLMEYHRKFAHTHRLKNLMLDDVIEFCLSPDQTRTVPLYRNGVITDYRNL